MTGMSEEETEKRVLGTMTESQRIVIENAQRKAQQIVSDAFQVVLDEHQANLSDDEVVEVDDDHRILAVQSEVEE